MKYTKFEEYDRYELESKKPDCLIGELHTSSGDSIRSVFIPTRKNVYIAYSEHDSRLRQHIARVSPGNETCEYCYEHALGKKYVEIDCFEMYIDKNQIGTNATIICEECKNKIEKLFESIIENYPQYFASSFL